MEHLIDPTKVIVSTYTDAQRIKFIERDVWIGYDFAIDILDKMEELMNYPRNFRMKSLLVTGTTDNGKTAIFRRFRHLHRSLVNDAGDVEFPVVSIQLPPRADECRLMEELLIAMMQPVKFGTKAPDLFKAVRTALRDLHCKILLIDEVEHAMGANGKNQRYFIDTLKFLSNDLSLPIVAFGPAEALNVFSSDPQLDNRFKKAVLPLWEGDIEFRRYLASYEKLLPLKQASNLREMTLSNYILHKTNGTIGEITDVVKLAAMEAIRTGKEQITKQILDKVDLKDFRGYKKPPKKVPESSVSSED